MLPTTITIQTRQVTQDGQGGYAEEWANTYQEVPGRLSDLTGRESQMASREHVEADYMLTVPYSQNIDTGMRVVHNSQVFEVVHVNTHSSLATVRRCLVKQV